MTSAPIAWTADELALMREHYVQNGAAWMAAHLLARSQRAVWIKAADLGLHRNKDWQHDEDEALRANYFAHGAAKVVEITGRSETAVHSRAAKLGIFGDRNRRKPRKEKADPAVNPNMTRIPTRQPAQWAPDEQAVITSETRVTIAPPFVDRRWIVDNVPRAVSSAECREWAKVSA